MTPHRDAILDALTRRLGEELPESEEQEAQGSRLYALVDLARDEAIGPQLKTCGHKKSCLYKGAPPELEAVAPWLVDLEQGGSAFLEWLVERGWGQAWAVFLISRASLGELRKHFRRFLQVYTEQGTKLYFRFNDPRVLRAYLPTCTQEELDFVIGPVSWFLVEGADARELLELCLDEEDGLTKHIVAFERGEEPPPAAAQVPPEVQAVLDDLAGGNGSAGQELERVRDALAANPGRSELLAFLRDHGGRHYAAAVIEADAFRESLGSLSEQQFEVEGLQPLLSGFSDGSWRAAFTALTPGFQSWLRGSERAALAQSCQALVDLAALTEKAHDLRSRLREAKEAGEASEEERAAKATLAALKEAQAASAGWPEGDARLQKVRAGVERLAGRLESRLSARSATSGLTSLLVTLGRGDPQEAARVSKGVLAALAGTEASDGGNGATAAAVSLPELAPRQGRYTMRRKALPFQRSKLVVREEQITALAEANWRDRAARLRAYARAAHPAKLEELGEDRVAEIVQSCMEKALALTIQKRPAIETLLDLMLEIDPEFAELDEYAWANDLLQSDMLDPDSKPGLIRDQLED